MKSFNIPSLTFSFVCLLAAPAFADFVGPYEVSNWTMSLNGGSIDTSGAPSSISMVSSNAGNGTTNQDFTLAAVETGLISFGWVYSTVDWNPSYDPFGYLFNGAFFQLTDSNGSNNQDGSASFIVNAGDVFGFRAFSTDSIFGSATTVISNFSGPAVQVSGNPSSNTVPEPSTVLLLGSGLVGMVAWRMKNGKPKI